jgi:hypothetical protein
MYLWRGALASPGLPDVYFGPKIQIGVNLDGLRMENVGIFYGHLQYFTPVVVF